MAGTTIRIEDEDGTDVINVTTGDPLSYSAYAFAFDADTGAFYMSGIPYLRRYDGVMDTSPINATWSRSDISIYKVDRDYAAGWVFNDVLVVSDGVTLYFLNASTGVTIKTFAGLSKLSRTNEGGDLVLYAFNSTGVYPYVTTSGLGLTVDASCGAGIVDLGWDAIDGAAYYLVYEDGALSKNTSVAGAYIVPVELEGYHVWTVEAVSAFGVVILSDEASYDLTCDEVEPGSLTLTITLMIEQPDGSYDHAESFYSEPEELAGSGHYGTVVTLISEGTGTSESSYVDANGQCFFHVMPGSYRYRATVAESSYPALSGSVYMSANREILNYFSLDGFGAFFNILVKDEDGAAIPSVNLQFQTYAGVVDTAVTGAGGNWSGTVDGLLERVRVFASKSGYDEKYRDFYLSDYPYNETVGAVVVPTASFTLPAARPSYNLTVRVRDRLSSALIENVSVAYSTPDMSTGTVLTNVNGLASASSTALGEWLLEFSHPDYVDLDASLTIAYMDDFIETYLLEPSGAGTYNVSGYLFIDGAGAASYASLHYVCQLIVDGYVLAQSSDTVVASAAGVYFIEGVRGGSQCLLEAESAGFEASQSLSVGYANVEGYNLTLTVAVKRYRISGVARDDESGDPLRGTAIYLSVCDSTYISCNLSRTAIANTLGQYTFDKFPGGYVRMLGKAANPNYVEVVHTFLLRSDVTQDFRFGGAAPFVSAFLSVQEWECDGESLIESPIEGAYVSFIGSDGETVASVQSSSTGLVGIRIPAGVYRTEITYGSETKVLTLSFFDNSVEPGEKVYFGSKPSCRGSGILDTPPRSLIESFKQAEYFVITFLPLLVLFMCLAVLAMFARAAGGE